jgi:hypothetical protein
MGGFGGRMWFDDGQLVRERVECRLGNKKNWRSVDKNR